MESDPLARRERQIAVPRADVLSQCFVAELHLVLVAGLVVLVDLDDVREAQSLEGRLLVWGIPATGVLAETLLGRGAESDVAEAEAAIERLAAAPADEGLVMRDIWLLRLRALLARAHGDAATYAHFRDRYRDMATSLGFEGHIAWAEAMP
jgi:hypothetical protein